jgi:hypothetical protein
LERFLLAVPSVWHEHSIPLGVMELFMTTGFAAAFALAVLTFLRTFPAMPLADPAVYGGVHEPADAPAH